MRFFNTAGPMDAARHYTVPPLSRIDLDEVLLLIENNHRHPADSGNISKPGRIKVPQGI